MKKKTVSHHAAPLLWSDENERKQPADCIPQSPAQTCELFKKNIFLGYGKLSEFGMSMVKINLRLLDSKLELSKQREHKAH